jgi:hypothetical protein
MTSSREAVSTEAGKLGDTPHDVRTLDGIHHHGVRQRREGMVRPPQQDSAQSHDVPGDGKRDALAPAARQ